MESNTNRADGFYKFLALVGLIVAVSSAGLATWSVQRGQERVFALEAEVAAASAGAAIQQADLRRVQNYLDEMRARVRTATDRGTPHYNFLVDEVAKTTRRVEQAQLELDGKTNVAAAKTSQISTFRTQRLQDIRLGGIVAGGGLVITLLGLTLWYWRVQRYLEIENQARMTRHLVEEIVTRSRTEAVRAREEASDTLTSNSGEVVAVVSERRQEVPSGNQKARRAS